MVGPTVVYLLDFFYSGSQLYILLSHCLLFFISFLYLDLYLLGDDKSISNGSFMRTKHLFVLIRIRNKGEVVSTMKQVSSLH